jgi:hypothetical protein
VHCGISLQEKWHKEDPLPCRQHTGATSPQRQFDFSMRYLILTEVLQSVLSQRRIPNAKDISPGFKGIN